LDHDLIMPPTGQNPTVAPVQLSPTLAATGTYPFVKLEQAKRRLAAQGIDLIDFGKGDPREPTDSLIRQALADSISEISTYPLAEGLPELRAAVARWCGRRFGVELDPDTEIIPTYGSKEAIFLLAQVVVERSSMTGYRSGFVAAQAELVAALKQFRPSVGTAPQEFVQRASIAAWDDEKHVERTRAAYRRKRDALLPTLTQKGVRIAGAAATMFLWLEVPEGESSSEAFAARLLEHGVIVSPGTFFGPAGEGYWRMALVPTEEECRRAAEILEDVL